jgi:hypothetical protein
MAKSGVCRLAQVVTPSIEARMTMKRARRKMIIRREGDGEDAEDRETRKRGR